MEMEKIKQSAERGNDWLLDHLATADDLPLYADQAWGLHMLLSRFREEQTERVVAWRETLDQLLGQAADVSFDFQPQEDEHAQRLQFVIQVDSCLMVACLLHHYQGDSLATQEFKRKALAKAEAHPDTFRQLSFLYKYSRAYLYQKLDVPVPSELHVKESYSHLPPFVKFVVESYYLTHWVLFDADMFTQKLDAANYQRVVDYIRQHGAQVMQQGMHDLVAEFAICMSLLGLQEDPVYAQLIGHLLDSQSAEGHWQQAGYDEREWRHATVLSVVALFDRIKTTK